MAFINAFQGGQQFQALQDQRKQDLTTSKENLLIRQQQNVRADKSLDLRQKEQASLAATRATSAERLAAADQVAAKERERVNQLRATNNTVNFIQAGIKRGVPINEVLQSAAQPLQAMGVTPDQFGALAQQIEQDPGILDQFKSALTQQQGARKATGKPIAVRIGGKLVLGQSFTDGSFEVIEDAVPVSEELGARRAAVAEQRIEPKAAGVLAGVKAEEKEVGKARGKTRAEDLPRGARATARAKRAVASRKQRSDLVNSSIDEAIEDAGFFTTGFIGSTLSNIPGTDAFDLSATIDTIRANIGFDELQRLRDNSPTGGALGQISERENILLQSVLGSVEQAQSEAQFKQRLNDVKEQFKRSQELIAEAFEADFGVPYRGPGTPIPAAPVAQAVPGQTSLDDLLDEFAPRGQ